MIKFEAKQFDYSVEEVLSAAKEGRLLSAEIEFNRRCNYRCPYCYASGDYKDTVLDSAVAADAIRQVAALGARKIVILGGEPLLYQELKEKIKLITSLGMAAEIFTNAALITPEWAEFFLEYGCRVVVKLNSLRPEVQEQLTGVPGALDKALNAIRILKASGFDRAPGQLVASSVISSANADEVVDLWKYLRRNDIKPYLEIMTPQGRLLENRDLEVHPTRLREIFEEISAFDREMGFEWEPQPPLVGAKCLRHQYSCVISATGDIIPCVGLTVKLGNIYEQPLREILQNSVVLAKLKDFRNTIKGPCKSCEKADSCYGCRGAAYQLTGDYLASDPLCWKNGELLNLPPALPCAASDWIPHRKPMLMARTLREVGEVSVIDAVIDDENIFQDGEFLDNDAVPEIAAQACACIGFADGGRKTQGVLTGLRDCEQFIRLKYGETITVHLRETAKIDAFHTLEYQVFNAEGLLSAKGEFVVCENI